jgi:hypothetical protein
MALDNIDCPQFVDFANNATFDMYDGADHLFGKCLDIKNIELVFTMIIFLIEKGLVGELDLGFEDNVNKKDELIAALNSNSYQ